ncbi:MAG: type II toxin-antitoxin system mRNA interferase toxin, RelE/StbE family [Nitrospirae bacterium]|nr:type II toxin-antitoxin system mRNA interferase toxin, RelE/StbE family [Nitrospirota bacterium]
MGQGEKATRPLTWRIVVTPTAVRLIKAIADKRLREKISDVIDRLANEPDKQGKPLTGELTGFRSIRAVGQRYRIIYAVRKDEIVVVIVAAGIRKEGHRGDIYALARKLIRLRLLEP